jgi:hypothetical protein
MKVNIPRDVVFYYSYNLFLLLIDDKFLLVILHIWNYNLYKLPEKFTLQNCFHISCVHIP